MAVLLAGVAWGVVRSRGPRVRTVVAVRELAATYGLASTQDGVIELAVDELARRLREEVEGERWADAVGDPSFGRETADLAAAYATADRETWPRE